MDVVDPFHHAFHVFHWLGKDVAVVNIRYVQAIPGIVRFQALDTGPAPVRHKRCVVRGSGGAKLEGVYVLA